jgi:hypothetical protein
VEGSCEYGFHKMLGSSGVAVQLAASREGLTCMQLGSHNGKHFEFPQRH